MISRKEIKIDEINRVNGGTTTDAEDLSHHFYTVIWCPTCHKSFNTDQGGSVAKDKKTGEMYYQCPSCGKLVSLSGRQL